MICGCFPTHLESPFPHHIPLQTTVKYRKHASPEMLFLYADASVLPAFCSCGDAPVAPLPAAGEPAPAGPDPRPDGQERAAPAAQHGPGRVFPSTLSFRPRPRAHLSPDQLPVIQPRFDCLSLIRRSNKDRNYMNGRWGINCPFNWLLIYVFCTGN